MTQFILVRHTNPDYSVFDSSAFKIMNGHCAPLSEEGIEQAKKLAKNKVFNDADVLISSPYTRTMQTASYISLETKLPIICEYNLHEWVPDVRAITPDSRQKIRNNFFLAVKDFDSFRYVPNGYYESLFLTEKRALSVLDKYLDLEKVIVVTHSGVLYSLTRKKFKQAQYLQWEYKGR